jgi:hypothetical protein
VSCRRIAVAVGLVVMVATSAATADEGWTLSKLNPFHKASTSKQSTSSASSLAHATGFPKMSLPSWNSSSKKTHSKKPSTWSKVTQSTHNMWDKTKDALTPGSSTKKAKPKKKSSVSGMFSSWVPFGSKK